MPFRSRSASASARSGASTSAGRRIAGHRCSRQLAHGGQARVRTRLAHPAPGCRGPTRGRGPRAHIPPRVFFTAQCRSDALVDPYSVGCCCRAGSGVTEARWRGRSLAPQPSTFDSPWRTISAVRGIKCGGLRFPLLRKWNPRIIRIPLRIVCGFPLRRCRRRWHSHCASACAAPHCAPTLTRHDAPQARLDLPVDKREHRRRPSVTPAT